MNHFRQQLGLPRTKKVLHADVQRAAAALERAGRAEPDATPLIADRIEAWLKAPKAPSA